MSGKTSGKNSFPAGESTRSVDVCSTSKRRRKSKLLGMARTNAAATLPGNGFGLLRPGVFWASCTEANHMPHKHGGHERLG